MLKFYHFRSEQNMKKIPRYIWNVEHSWVGWIHLFKIVLTDDKKIYFLFDFITVENFCFIGYLNLLVTDIILNKAFHFI